jgi:hypothetical protein
MIKTRNALALAALLLLIITGFFRLHTPPTRERFVALVRPGGNFIEITGSSFDLDENVIEISSADHPEENLRMTAYSDGHRLSFKLPFGPHQLCVLGADSSTCINTQLPLRFGYVAVLVSNKYGTGYGPRLIYSPKI